MQDYKHIHYNSTKRKEEAKSGKKISLFFLLLLILMIGAAVFLQKQPEVKKKVVQLVNSAKQENKESPIRFTFYDILASGEVVVGKDLLIEPEKEEIYLQLGAFKTDTEADNFQAELNLKGFHPQVQSLFLPEKTGRWFIVRLGKVKDDQELALLKQQLEQNKIEYAIVSRKD